MVQGFSPTPPDMDQEVTIPAEADYATLFWSFLAGGYSGSWDPQAFLRVEVRDTNGVVQTPLFIFSASPSEPQVWRTHSADLTEWVGKTIRLGFVAGRGTSGNWKLRLDAVTLAVGRTNETEFDVYLGPSTNLTSVDWAGRTSRPEFSPGRLEPGRRYFWRVDAIIRQTNIASQSWTFTVAQPGPLHHLEFSEFGAVQLANVAFPLSVFAADRNGLVLTNQSGAFGLEALGGDIREPSIAITEVAHELRDAIELMNVSTNDQSLAGWTAIIFDGRSATQRLSHVFAAGTVIAPGEVFVLGEEGVAPALPVRVFPVSNSVDWNLGSSVSASVLLLDASGAVADFVSIGVRPPKDLLHLGGIPASEWIGASVAEQPNFTPWSRQRAGNSDTGTAADWASSTPQIGQRNASLDFPFKRGHGALAFSTDHALVLSNGAWRGTATFHGPATNLQFIASFPGLVTGRGPQFDVQDLPYLTVAATAATEGQGLRTNAVALRLQFARLQDTVVEVRTARRDEIQLPERAVIPAGELEVFVPVTVLDDELLDGTQPVGIEAQAAWFATLPGLLLVHDNELATLTIEAPAFVTEGSVSRAVVHSSTAPGKDVQVSLQWSGVLASANPFVVLKKGERTVEFEFVALDNRILDHDLAVSISAAVSNWVSAVTHITLRDDEERYIGIKLPPTPAEGMGVLTNAGLVFLSGITRTNLEVRLRAEPTNQIAIPLQATIPAGSSNAFFSIVLQNVILSETNTPVVVHADAQGFAPGTEQLVLADDDPARFSVSIPPGPVTAGLPVVATVRALDPGGAPMNNGTYEIELKLVDGSGTILAPAFSAALANGLGTAILATETGAVGARLRAEGRGATGDSRLFNILAPLERVLPGNYRDFLVMPGGAGLLASVPSDAATNANQIVMIEPATGLTETWHSAAALATASDNKSTLK